MELEKKSNFLRTMNPLTYFREHFWLVRGREGRKLYPMMAMIWILVFNYTLVHNLKEVCLGSLTLQIMLLEISKSELISYLKLMGTLPVSVIFMVVYAKLAATRSKPFIFYSMSIFFMVLYALLMLAYAFKDNLQPARMSLENTFPKSLKPIATALEVPILNFNANFRTGSLLSSLSLVRCTEVLCCLFSFGDMPMRSVRWMRQSVSIRCST